MCKTEDITNVHKLSREQLLEELYLSPAALKDISILRYAVLCKRRLGELEPRISMLEGGQPAAAATRVLEGRSRV